MSADLGALLSRLEAVTTKLETVATGKGSVEGKNEVKMVDLRELNFHSLRLSA